MAIIVYYFNRKMLQLDKKDRERPIMVQLLRFFIAPLKEWFSSQKNLDEFKELDEARLEEIFRLKIPVKTYDIDRGTHNLPILSKPPQPPHPKLLYTEFKSLLERLHLESEWDKKLQNYNELQRNLHGKINELKQRIKKFVDESPGVKRIYDKTEASKSYSFEAFKNELVDKFCEEYRSSLLGNKLGGAWYFAGSELFDHVKLDNKSVLEEMDKLRENRKLTLDDLISFLEQVQKRLRKEYDLTPSEQEPLIELEISFAVIN
jgi:hypothetical protein